MSSLLKRRVQRGELYNCAPKLLNRLRLTSSYLVSKFAAFMLGSMLFPAVGLAQNTNSGEIRGTVTDPSGATIPGVTVTILNTQTGVTRDLVTNNSGIYDAISILPGSYSLAFSKEGFNKLVRSGVEINVNPVAVDAQLTIGTSTQQVSVTEQAPVLQTESGEQSTTLDYKAMQTLPNVGQNWANFTRILPGAAGSGNGVAVNGNMPYYSNFLADGANVSLPHSSNFDSMVFEDLAEVQMATSSFSAQYGVGGAVYNQISKSGTNQFHGSAYEYFQNDALNATNFFSHTVPQLRYHKFGGAIGGPVIKNKFSSSSTRTRSSTTQAIFSAIPTPQLSREPAFCLSTTPRSTTPLLGRPIRMQRSLQANLIPSRSISYLCIQLQIVPESLITGSATFLPSLRLCATLAGLITT